MNELKKILTFLEMNRESGQKSTMWIPSIWNSFGYQGILGTKGEEIFVDAYDFYSELIRFLLDQKREESLPELKPKDVVMYSSLVRYSTAWDIHHQGKISTGSFLRHLVLLPFLLQLKVNTLYLLPVSDYSTKYLKGGAGCPFAIKDYRAFATDQEDSLLKDSSDLTLEGELKALIQGAHCLGIRVITDFIPRTAARDCRLLEDHPEWFYWISLDALESFKSPRVEGVDDFVEPTKENVRDIYRSDSVRKHISSYRFSPDRQNPGLWSELKEQSVKTGEDLLGLVEKEMGITTAPAYSDWINDSQPVWTDVTFFRMFLDVHEYAGIYAQAEQPPYVVFDIIKSSNFKGRVPNQELWDYLKSTLVYYTDELGFDGFRMDMAHALPGELEKDLIETVRSRKADALMVCEALFNRDHEKAHAAGYNLMQGESWLVQSELEKSGLSGFIKDQSTLKVPIFAAAEIPDTPRCASRKGGAARNRLTAVINGFLPNCIPFISSGYEVLEDQPLNTALADNSAGNPISKAFFDWTRIDWLRKGAKEMLDLIQGVHEIRDRYGLYINADKLRHQEASDSVVAFGYDLPDGRLQCLFNLSFDEIAEHETGVNGDHQILLDSHGKTASLTGTIQLDPGQAVIWKELCRD